MPVNLSINHVPDELAERLRRRADAAHAARRSALTGMLQAYPLLAIGEVQPAAEDIARLAEDTESTAYDATYLWLAQLLGAPIVTLDRRLAEAARSLGLP